MNAAKFAVLGIAVFLGATDAGAERPRAYVCSSEKVGGYFFENNRWNWTQFSDQDTFVLKQTDAIGNSPDPAHFWSLTFTGKKSPSAKCSDDFTFAGKIERSDLVRCNGLIKMSFSTTSLRF